MNIKLDLFIFGGWVGCVNNNCGELLFEVSYSRILIGWLDLIVHTHVRINLHIIGWYSYWFSVNFSVRNGLFVTMVSLCFSTCMYGCLIFGLSIMLLLCRVSLNFALIKYFEWNQYPDFMFLWHKCPLASLFLTLWRLF